MRILTLDGGGQFGFAHGDPHSGRIPISGSHKLPAGQTTKLMIALEAWCIDMIKGNEITDVYIEKSIITPNSAYATTVTLAGYNLIAGIAATKCGVNAYLVDMQSWRSELGLPTQGPKNVLAHPDYAHMARLQNGKLRPAKAALSMAKRAWVKDRAKDFAVKHGSDPIDDNESDAICIYHAMVQRIRNKVEQARYDLFADLTV